MKFSVMFSVVVPPGGGSTGYVRTLGEWEAGQSRRRAPQARSRRTAACGHDVHGAFDPLRSLDILMFRRVRNTHEMARR